MERFREKRDIRKESEDERVRKKERERASERERGVRSKEIERLERGGGILESFEK